MDQRSIRTKNKLKQTLRDMIISERPEDITVKALTERAGIHRKTFYIHYETIEFLYRDLGTDIVEDISVMLASNQKETGQIDARQLLETFFLYLDQDPLHRKIIEDEEHYHFFFEQIRQASVAYLAQLIPFRSDLSEAQRSAVHQFLANGFWGATRDWLRNAGNWSDPELLDLLTNLVEIVIQTYYDSTQRDTPGQ